MLIFIVIECGSRLICSLFFFFLPHFWVWCIIRKETLLKSVTGSSSITVDPTQVTQISWNPRFYFFYYCGFYVVCLIIFLDNCWYGICCSFVFYRAFLYRGFLTDEECDHLIALVSLYFLFLFEWMLIYIYICINEISFSIYTLVLFKRLYFSLFYCILPFGNLLWRAC